ncbi:hypothetical protein WJX74_005526 [Apatococcus lobatus]|uniref:Exostosin GT47 domain-containing protein n=1 Tax=Apatococcus lobatus TaxID=904363 RepID=A0AAW1RKS5_9CHLO
MDGQADQCAFQVRSVPRHIFVFMLMITCTSCSQLPRIYVASLPPQFNVNLLGPGQPCPTGDALTPAGADAYHRPLGELLPDAPDWFRASAYQALEVFVHQQLLESPFRVHELHQADLVYVPIYLEHIAVPTHGDMVAQLRRQHDSLFCIQPHGDLPTRIAFYDCIGLATTLPVVFDHHMLANLAFSDVVQYRSFAVYLPLEQALDASVSVVAELQKLDMSSLVSQLEALRNVSHVMVYASDPQHKLVSFQSRWDITPQDDAFTMSVKAVLRNLCQRDMFQGSQCS